MDQNQTGERITLPFVKGLFPLRVSVGMRNLEGF